jgi:G3E family GTPase
MTDLYLITGFLGSGKTTYIKKFLPQFKGKKIALIVNEFGQEGVDGRLLSDMQAAVAEISGGSIFCTCKFGDFENELKNVLTQERGGAAVNVVIIETSGLSDPVGIHKALELSEFAGKIHYCGCICMVDCTRFYKLYETAPTVRKQINAATDIIYTKEDIANDEQIVRTKALVEKEIAEQKQRPAMLSADLAVHALTLSVDEVITSDELHKILEAFIKETYRVKGFVKLADGDFFVDGVGDACHFDRLNDHGTDTAYIDNKLAVLYGHGLSPRKIIKGLTHVAEC